MTAARRRGRSMRRLTGTLRGRRPGRGSRGCPRRLLTVAALAVLTAVLAHAAPAHADVGFRDFSYSGTSAPTGQKPQSKLWFADGIWWGSLFNTSTTDFEIYRLNSTTNAWSSTGTRIDDRASSRADTLWDGSRLYVATAGTSSTSSGRVVRYTYNSSSKSYALDPGFPVTVINGGVEAVVLDKDSTGKIWVTFTQGSKTYVAHSTSDDRTWTAPYVLPVTGASNLTTDDISAVVAYDGQIGVMWSNQNDSAMYFASHRDGDPDGVWSPNTALKLPEYADDHINLRSLQADPSGRVFAATKTSLNQPGDPLIQLLVLQQNDSWARHTFGRVSDNHTRPMVVIDREHRQLYMFAASPCCNGGAIYYKQTSLDSISFAPGLGTPFMQSATDTHINNLSSTKQELNARTGLVAIAGDDTTRTYWHNSIPLGATPPDTRIDSGPQGTVTDTTAAFTFSSTEAGSRFECSLDAAPFGACASPKSYSGLAVGSHTFRVRAIDGSGNVDPSPASRTWTVGASGTAIFSDGFESGSFSAWSLVQTGAGGAATVQSAVVRAGAYAARLSATAASGSYAFARKSFSPARTGVVVSGHVRIDTEGASGGNVPIFRLYDPSGTRLLSLYRQNQSGDRLWVGHSAANHSTTGKLPRGVWGHVELRVVTAGTGASTVVASLNGIEIYRTAAANLGTAGVATIQIGNDTRSQAFTLFADDVRAETP